VCPDSLGLVRFKRNNAMFFLGLERDLSAQASLL